MENLEKLHLYSCHELTDISALASLKNLNELDLSSCEKLKDISDLESLKNCELPGNNISLHVSRSKLCYSQVMAKTMKVDKEL